MKNLSHVLILFVLPLFFVTCSKDDDSDTAEEKGEIIINGEKHALHSGVIWYFMEHPDNVYNFFIVLNSSGILGDIEEGFSGYGDIVGFNITSQNLDLPDPGTYPIVTEEEAGNPDEVVNPEILIGYDVENNVEVVEQYYVCISGDVVFNKEDDEYEITFNAVGNKLDYETDNILEEDIDISIHYKGSLTEIL